MLIILKYQLRDIVQIPGLPATQKLTGYTHTTITPVFQVT